MWLFTNLTGLCLISYNFVMGHIFKRVSYWKDVQKRGRIKYPLLKYMIISKSQTPEFEGVNPSHLQGGVCVYITPN